MLFLKKYQSFTQSFMWYHNRWRKKELLNLKEYKPWNRRLAKGEWATSRTRCSEIYATAYSAALCITSRHRRGLTRLRCCSKKHRSELEGVLNGEKRQQPGDGTPGLLARNRQSSGFSIRFARSLPTRSTSSGRHFISWRLYWTFKL